jgi:hypothetical protein
MSDEFLQFQLEEIDVVAVAGGANKACIIKGRQIYASNMVRSCGVYEQSNSTIKIFANVVSTTNPRGNGHEIELKIDRSNGNQNITSMCSCPSGKVENCKHIMSVLIKIQQEQKIKVVSCTEIPRQWGNFDSDIDLSFLKLSNFCVSEKHPQKSQKENSISKEERELHISTILNGKISH